MKVTQDQITAFTLSRQGLLKPFPHQKVTKVVENIGALHSQILATAPTQLWARVKDFKVNDLWNALYHQRTLVRTYAMRGTLHIVPSTRFDTFVSAIGPMENTWNRIKKEIENKLDIKDIMRTRRLLVSAFKEKPMMRKELPKAVKDSSIDKFVSVVRWSLVPKYLNCLGLIVYGEMRGLEIVFHEAEEWLGRKVKLYDSSKANANLLNIYLKSLGPASLNDYRYWTGLRMSQIQPAHEYLKELLVEVEVDCKDKPLLLLKRDINDLEKAEIPDGHVRLLPKFDPVILGHADKSRLLDKKYHKKVFVGFADVDATLLIDGQVAGTWKHEKRGKNLRIIIKPFKKLHSPVKKKIKELANELSTIFDTHDVIVTFT